ncbi:MAG TPA: hypothetical protein VL492_07350 [Methylovirgula sp.]|jgi:hypothetical protein|nr:hypothetical protein [Methylovirgula sp.]
MQRTRLLPTTVAVVFVLADVTAVVALPIVPSAGIKTTASSSDTILVRRGVRSGELHGGGYVARPGYGRGDMYAGRYGGWNGRYGYGWGAAAAATGVGVAVAAAPHVWYGEDSLSAIHNCGPYSYPGNICVPH